MQITLTIARAAGADAANKQMRAAGRSVWSAADFDLAAETTLRLIGGAA